MKMGVKEFREKMSEVLHGRDAVMITHHGRMVGTYRPASTGAAAFDWDDWLAGRDRLREEWRAATPDWRARMAAIGLDENGDLITP